MYNAQHVNNLEYYHVHIPPPPWGQMLVLGTLQISTTPQCQSPGRSGERAIHKTHMSNCATTFHVTLSLDRPRPMGRFRVRHAGLPRTPMDTTGRYDTLALVQAQAQLCKAATATDPPNTLRCTPGKGRGQNGAGQCSQPLGILRSSRRGCSNHHSPRSSRCGISFCTAGTHCHRRRRPVKGWEAHIG